ncbi:MAG: pectinesterase family protein, partial [Chitinispirillia bacterium]
MLTKKYKYYIKSAIIIFFFLLIHSYGGKKIIVPHDFSTIHSALGEVDEGDTVYVVNGVYKENIALSDNIVLMGQEMTKTVIDGRRLAPCVLGADGAVITGFTIRNGSTGILCKNSRPIIKGNFIVDNKGAGIHALISLPEIKNN